MANKVIVDQMYSKWFGGLYSQSTPTPTPTPTPAPAFSGNPTISPTSGDTNATYTATDPTITDGTITLRQWLLGTTVLGTGTTIVPGAGNSGSLTRKVTGMGTDGSTITATSTAVTVATAATPSVTMLPTISKPYRYALAASKIVPEYTGPLLQVRRFSDDATLDIPIASDGFSPDDSGIAAFASGQSVYLSKLYDQTGNAIHATANTSHDTPILYMDANGLKALPFRNRPSIYNGDRYSLSLPSNIAVMSSFLDWSLFFSTRQIKYEGLQNTTYLNQQNSSPFTFGEIRGTGDGTVFADVNGTPSNQTVRIGVSPHFLSYRDNATNGNVEQRRVDDHADDTGAVFYRFDTGGGINFTGMGAFLAVDGATTNTDETAIRNWFQANFDTPTTFPSNYNVINAGDSIVNGNASTLGRSWVNLSAPKINGNANVFSSAIDGESFVGGSNRYSATIAPHYDASAKANILIAGWGTNDLANDGQTPAQAYARLVAFCQTARATGFKIIVHTLLYRGGQSNSVYDAYNTMVKNGWHTIADDIADVNSDSVLGNPNSLNDATLFEPAKIHPLNAGHALMEPYYTAAVNRIIAANP